MPGSPSYETFDSDGVRIRYVDQGDGEPVVLVHGYMQSGKDWKAAHRALGGGFRTLALDCRGHGKSDKPHDVTSYGVEMVADIVRLMDHLGITRSHVVGYSMGAEIALKLATRHPDRVRTLHVGGSGWSTERDVALYALIADSFEQSGGVGPFLDALAASNHPGLEGYQLDLSWPKKQLFKLVVRLQDTDALAAVARGMREIANLTAEDVSGLRMPVLGIAGEHDPERPNLERMVGVLPGYDMRVIAGKDHLDAFKDPQYVNSIVELLGDAGPSDGVDSP